MKQIRQFFVVAGILLAATTASAATIDQNISSGWWLQIQYAQPIAQSFTAEDVNVDWIGMYVGDGNTQFNDLTVTMSLYSGDGIFTTDHLLMTQEIDLGAFVGGEGYADMDVSSYNFTVGSMYTMALSNNTARWGAVLADQDYYQGGILYDAFGSLPGSESRFHVIASTASVPEPSTMLLLGTGLLGFARVSRRKKKQH